MSDVFVDGNFLVAGCKCGRDCEFPCWQRVGLTTKPCCPGCSTLPADPEPDREQS